MSAFFWICDIFDTHPLRIWIRLKKLNVDYCKASDALRTWGLGEGNDLGVSRQFIEFSVMIRD